MCVTSEKQKVALRRILPERSWHIHIGDTVFVRRGPQTGIQTTVNEINKQKNSLILKGVNMRKRHVQVNKCCHIHIYIYTFVLKLFL